MLYLSYPSRALVGDWLRTVTGLAIGLGALLSVEWSFWIIAIFGSITLLFSYFGLRTLERQLQTVGLSEEGVLFRDWRQRALPWDEIEGLRLRFYGTRRQHRRLGEGEDPTGGFLELRLQARGRKAAMDSTLPGFSLVAWRAAKAARERGLSIDPVTAGNLLTLGVDPDKDTPPPELAQEWSDAVAGP